MHAKFICGITGVIRDEDGRVLLLRHRLWPESRQWGFPTGYANKGERHEDTIIREVREETGLSVKPGRLLMIRSGYKYRIEMYYEATLTSGLDNLTLDSRGILDARLFSLDELPESMPDNHRELAAAEGERRPGRRIRPGRQRELVCTEDGLGEHVRWWNPAVARILMGPGGGCGSTPAVCHSRGWRALADPSGVPSLG